MGEWRRESEREMEGGGMEKSKSRKEKRKEKKKKKRKEVRKERAVKEREEEEALMNDEEYRIKMELLELQDSLRMERERLEFEERERAFQQHLLLLLQNDNNNNNLLLQQSSQDSSSSSEQEEEGFPEIIWKGNEIILNKNNNNKKKKNNNNNKTINNTPTPQKQLDSDDDNDNSSKSKTAAGSSSNPLPPNLNPNPNPNFGTEKDKAHCPFHLKTGACRFGHRCSRLHFYPTTSSTLLIFNMFTPPSSSLPLPHHHDHDHDDSLEYTDEEVESSYQEFYDDVHTEFLKFGEIVNFKVCKNGAFHLRGNVYVQYKSLDSALLAYNSVNGRYFAGKQITCNFVNLTRWKVAICGEYMKSGYKTCSHGTACNFIHCFRNPGGDYEWADLDKPPPMYWVKKMAALFGYSDDYVNLRERENFCAMNSRKMSKTDSDRHHSRRSRSREVVQFKIDRSSRRKHEDERRQVTPDEEQDGNLNDNYKRERRTPDTDSEREWLDKEGYREKCYKHARKSSFNRKNDDNSRSHEEDSDTGWATITRDTEKQHRRQGRNSRISCKDSSSKDFNYEAGPNGDGDRKGHRHSKRKSATHQSRDDCNISSESEYDKDSFDKRDMETQPDYSRKSRRHRKDDEEVDEGWSRRESSRRAHHHKKKTSKH